MFLLQCQGLSFPVYIRILIFVAIDAEEILGILIKKKK